MNKTLKLALGMVLTAGFVGSALAQDQFPDVPDNHWAYEALGNMKKNGLLVGYPDGLFRGGRPATRYEMAVAIHATYQHLKNITDGLQSQIDELKNRPQGESTKDLRDALTALQNDVNSMKGWGDDIANLKKMASTFEKELASMGVDIEAMKKDLKDLNDRVTKLEKNALPITIHGDVNFFMQAGQGTSKRNGIGTDGQIVGGGFSLPNDAGRSAGILDGLSVFHEANIKIAGTNEEGPKWNAVLSIGNMLNGYGSKPGVTSSGLGTTGPNAGSDAAGTDIAFRRLVVEFDNSLLGQNFNAKLGRFGYKISPYIYQSPDTNPYYDSEFDNGEWTMDGLLMGFNFGSAKLNFIFGRTNNRNTSTGLDQAGVRVGSLGKAAGFTNSLGAGTQLAADSTIGLHANIPLSDAGGLDLAYLIHSQNAPTTPIGGTVFADNVHVFGLDMNYKFGAIKFNGGYSQSNTFLGKKSVVTRDNYAWDLNAAYEADRWGVGLGYREIAPNFAAAGDWGRVGSIWNPTDFKGFQVKAHLNLNDAWTVKGAAELDSGLGKTYRQFSNGPLITGNPTSSHMDSYKIDLDYKMASGWNATLGAEWVDFRVAGAPRVTERWYNIGLGYNLSENASFKFLWQMSDADARGTGAFGAANRFTGNLLTTQFTLKF